MPRMEPLRRRDWTFESQPAVDLLSQAEALTARRHHNEKRIEWTIEIIALARREGNSAFDANHFCSFWTKLHPL